MRVSRSALWVMPALLLSLVTAIPLSAQKSAPDARNKSAQDDWNSPTETAPNPHGSKPGKSDTKNVADGAAKGQASEGIVKSQDKGTPSISGSDGAAKGQATEGIYVKPHDTSSPWQGGYQNVADGAAKGQASEGVVKERDMGSPGITSADGAAKG